MNTNEFVVYKDLSSRSWRASHGHSLGDLITWLASEWFWGEGNFIDASTSGHIHGLLSESLESRSKQHRVPLTRLLHTFAPWDSAALSESTADPVEVAILAGDTGQKELEALVHSIAPNLIYGRSLVVAVGSNLENLEGILSNALGPELVRIHTNESVSTFGRDRHGDSVNLIQRSGNSDRKGARSEATTPVDRRWTPPLIQRRVDELSRSTSTASGGSATTPFPGPPAAPLQAPAPSPAPSPAPVSPPEARAREQVASLVETHRRVERDLREQLEQALTKSAHLQVENQKLIQEKEDLWKWCEPIVEEAAALRAKNQELWAWAEPLIQQANAAGSIRSIPGIVRGSVKTRLVRRPPRT